MASNTGVSRRVSAVKLLKRIILLLVTIAAIVTPLGLYESVLPESEPQMVSFEYARDQTPMGYGTPPRINFAFNRMCTEFSFVTCPNVDANITFVRNATTRNARFPRGVNIDIPQKVIDTLQSGLSQFSSTVSSMFDIQWRSYLPQRDPDGVINNGSYYLTGSFRQKMNLVLNDRIEPVEGLIVDSKNGGIGFRNHTVPIGLENGATWSEDILFIQPETACVDTNITLEFRIPSFSSSSARVQNLTLVDHGGFVNLVPTYPLIDLNDTQANPDLIGRAYRAAWLNNVYSMIYLNVTNPKNVSDPKSKAFTYKNSVDGKKFALNTPLSELIPPTYDSLRTTTDFGEYLQPASLLTNGTLSNSSSRSNTISYPNPFKIGSSNFSDISKCYLS